MFCWHRNPWIFQQGLPFGCSPGWMYVLHAGASELLEGGTLYLLQGGTGSSSLQYTGSSRPGFDTIRSGGVPPPTGLVSALRLGNECTPHFYTLAAHTHLHFWDAHLETHPPDLVVWKRKILRNILQYYCMHDKLIEEGLLQSACMCGVGLRALASESLWELGVYSILQQVCCDPADSTQILSSSATACNQVKTILIWEKSAFAWKYSPHFWLHSALYAVNSQTESCYVTVQLSDLNLF